MNPVCGDPARTRRGMTGVIDDASHQPAALPAPDADHPHLRIDGTGVPGDVRIARVRMGIAEPVLHAQTTVEAYLALHSEAEPAERVTPKAVRMAHRRDDLEPDTLQVSGIGARR